MQRDFNPRAPCGARHRSCCSGVYSRAISIHVPLAGHDRLDAGALPAGVFQSTCPLRGTTLGIIISTQYPNDISIHMPLAGHDEAIKNVKEAK